MPSVKKPLNKSAQGFSAAEKTAMRERAQELKASQTRAAGEKVVLDKIASMLPSDRALAQKFHAIVTKTAPSLLPKTWYGMPAYANKDGKIICFFQDAAKFKTRYATFGFQHDAHLDAGAIWPVSFALVKWTPAVEKQTTALVTKAVS